MTTERKLLEHAAKACDRGLRWWNGDDGRLKWNPLTNSADCAAMCAKLVIDTMWYDDYVFCINWKTTKSQMEYYIHHNNCEAAWRYAATQVAAKIGGMK